MATTTKTEQYNFTITVTEGVTVSPHMLGKALAKGLDTLPDDTMDYVFDPMHGDQSSYRIFLDDEDAGEIGTCVITPVR